MTTVCSLFHPSFISIRIFLQGLIHPGFRKVRRFLLSELDNLSSRNHIYGCYEHCLVVTYIFRLKPVVVSIIFYSSPCSRHSIGRFQFRRYTSVFLDLSMYSNQQFHLQSVFSNEATLQCLDFINLREHRLQSSWTVSSSFCSTVNTSWFLLLQP